MLYSYVFTRPLDYPCSYRSTISVKRWKWLRYRRTPRMFHNSSPVHHLDTRHDNRCIETSPNDRSVGLSDTNCAACRGCAHAHAPVSLCSVSSERNYTEERCKASMPKPPASAHRFQTRRLLLDPWQAWISWIAESFMVPRCSKECYKPLICSL